MSSRGAFVVSDWRGLIRVQKWPRKRGKPTNPNVIWWNEWFRQANALAKYAPAAFQSVARRATSQSALMPRDIMLMAMRGRLFTFDIEGLGVIYSVAGRNDVSTALDLIGQAPGTIMYRGSDLWLPLTIGQPGQVLTAGANSTPEWADAGGGGSTPYSPPTTQTLPLDINADGIVTTNSLYDSLVLRRLNSATAPRWGGRFQTFAPQLATWLGGFNAANYTSTEISYGVAAYRSQTGKFAMAGILWENSIDLPTVTFMRTDTGGTIEATYEKVPLKHQGPIFFSWQDEGPTLLGSWGIQPDAMLAPVRINKADLGGDPTHYGIWIGWGDTAANRNAQQLSCIHWQQTPTP